jgi:hypothetical protein
MRPLSRSQEQVINTARRQASTGGPPPTIGDLSAQGVTGFVATCTKAGHPLCGHSHRLSWGDVGATDDTPFPDLARLPFRCSACGGSSIYLMPDWSTVHFYGTPDSRPEAAKRSLD